VLVTTKLYGSTGQHQIAEDEALQELIYSVSSVVTTGGKY